MLRRATLSAPRADGRDVGLPSLLVGAVCPGGELDERVQRHVHPGTLGLVLLHEVGVDASQDRLVRHDQDVLAALQLHDDGLEADHHVTVRLAPAVPVVVLVLVAGCEVVGEPVLDLLVREPVAYTRVELVERLPLQLVVVVREEPCRRDGAF